MKSKNGHKLLLVFAFLVMVFVAGLYAYMYYMIDVSITKVSNLRATIEASDLNRVREQSFLEAYQATAAKWVRLPEFFVPSGQIVEFIEAVESLGKESGSKVTLSSLDADNLDSATPGKQGKVKVHVNAQGSWSAVMKALTLAETLPYAISVNNFRASVGGDLERETRAKASTTKEVSKKNWNLSFDLEAKMIATPPTDAKLVQ